MHEIACHTPIRHIGTMRILLTLFVLFSVALGTTGFSKTLYSHNQLDLVAFQANSLSDVITQAECCSTDEEGADSQKPRCIGDVCINHTNTTADAEVISIKLVVIEPSTMDRPITTSFLRPPIV